jgi:hypothetical protein
MPIRLRIDELAKLSDAIVVARVETIRGWPLIGKRWAKARVTEVWKGPMMDNIEFLASGRDPCDISDAKRGETVLLFLTQKKELGWAIEHSGRGRMPLRTLNGKKYVTYCDVIFPAETQRIRIPDEKSEFNSAVELVTLRDRLKKTLQDKK